MGAEMDIEDETRFGFCRGCNKWKPRDEMISSGITIYAEGADNVADRIQVRLCPACHSERLSQWEELRWDPTLIEARHIRGLASLAAQCDEIEYDGSYEDARAALND